MGELKMKTIEGRNLYGDDRTYTFHLLNAKDGFELYHKFAVEHQLLSAMITSGIDKVNKDKKAGIDTTFTPRDIPQINLEIIHAIPQICSLEKITEIKKLLLSGCVMVAGDKKITLDENGDGDLDPFEIYCALFFSVVANYEPIIVPFLWALTPVEEDFTQEEMGQIESLNQTEPK